jgi:transposase
MFIKRRQMPNTDNHLKIQVCENFRENGRVRQKILKHIGTARNDMELRVLEKSAALFIEEMLMARSNGDVLFDARDCIANREPELSQLPEIDRSMHLDMAQVVEVKKITEGPQNVFAFAAQEEELTDIVPVGDRELLSELIAARITQPESKRKTFENLQTYAGFDCSLDKIYRLLTKLGKVESDINQKAFGTAQKLFGDEIDLLFFDVTTLYFESWTQDEIRDFGFSKDCKFGQVQITLALATQKDGFPVGYRLFSGKTAEISTLVDCIQEWKQHIAFKNVIFVADRGMFSTKNLHLLQELGYLFVVGCPLRKLGKTVGESILDENNYRMRSFESNGKTEVIWSGSFEHVMISREKDSTGANCTLQVGGKIVSTYSSKRALKDKTDREKMLEKAVKKITKESKSGASSTELKNLLGNKGHTKFLKVQDADKSKVKINEDKVAQDAMWDGMHGVFTNTSFDELEVLSRYRGLWQIESCFRVSKSTLKMRPIFHYTPERIRGHIALCFLSLVTLKIIEKRLRDAKLKVTTESLISEIKDIGSTIVLDKFTGTQFKIPSKLSERAIEIYKCLGLNRSSRTTKL